jgi:hypothetical protein
MKTITGVSDAIRQDAADGHLTKDVLASLLPFERRSAFLRACAVIEKKYTDACTETHDPCLESGCSCEGGDICLQPLLRAGDEPRREYGAEWLKLLEPVH